MAAVLACGSGAVLSHRAALALHELRSPLDGRSLETLLGRSAGRRGVQRVRDALAEMTGPAPWTQSHLERRFLALIRAAGLPEPKTNVLVEGELLDIYWPQARVGVELDGWEFHKTRSRFEDDRCRDAKLSRLDIVVIRLTDRRLNSEPGVVGRELWALVRRRAA